MTAFAKETLRKGEHGQVVRIIDGDSFVLNTGVDASDLNVSLGGIQSPKLANTYKNLKEWPLAQEAKNYLSEVLKDKTVRLYYDGDERDRYGRALAQVWTLNENNRRDIWVQEAMVRAGYARVYTWPSHKVETQKLYNAEKDARRNTRGIWNTVHTQGFYDIRSPDPTALALHVDSLQIVEGVIISTADVRGTQYLNFGSDYKTDFTIAISKKSKRVFKNAHYNPLALKGAHVRVRGWIELQNGPIIWINDPRRLEVLD
ncbi:MAG: nuclease (SNase) [Robiginitomaculum sp.]|nr:MAG: nuclease (SNase) [Robiginitomaculum sp.]